MAGLALAGCGSEQSDMGLLIGAARNAVTGGAHSSVTAKQVAAIPYPSLGVRVDGGAEFLVVLSIDSPHSRLWTQGKSLALETDDGRIVRSSGFARDLSGVSGDRSTPVSPLRALHDGGARTLLYDFADLNAYSVKTTCRISRRGRETLTILGKAIATQRLDETCRADALRWSFTNTYWVSDRGLVWQSVQYIHPRLGPITTELLRPPATP